MRPHALLCLLVALVSIPAASQAAQLRHPVLGGVAFSICEADLAKDIVRTFWKSKDGQIYGTLANLAAQQQASGHKLVCASNGGIFEATRRPLGLFIENGQILRHLNTRKHAYGNFYMEPNGVFALYADHAEIKTTDAFAAYAPDEVAAVRFATQSGPILIDHGVVNPTFTPGSLNKTSRNAVCLRSPTQISLVIAHERINFYDFAQTLKNRLGCSSALYLDGTVSDFFPTAGVSLVPPLGPMIGVIER